MIETGIFNALSALTNLTVYPLVIPSTALEGVTYQRISDPELDTGMVRTGLVAARFQISFIKIADYNGLLELDRKLWRDWRAIRHGDIGGCPVQYVERGTLRQSNVTLTDNQVQYRISRDFIIYTNEA